MFKKGELFDYRQIEGNANTKNIVFWTCCSFAYLKLVWLLLNTRIVLGHKTLLLPFVFHLFGKKSERGPDKGKIQAAKFE